MSFKTLHSFKISIDQEVEEVSVRNENGSEITVKSKVVKPVDHTIFLKEPTRRERQDLSLFHGRMINDAVTKHGFQPKAVLINKFSRDAESPLSQDEDKNLGKLYTRINELTNDLIRIKTISDDDYTKEQREKILLELQTLNRKVTDIETAYQSLFSYCAENYATNQSITWLVLMLSYIKDAAGEYIPMFVGKTFLEREESMFRVDEIAKLSDEDRKARKLTVKDEDDAKIFTESVEKLSAYWTLYFQGVASSPEDFVKLEAEMKKQLEARKGEEGETKDKAVEATPEVAPAPVVAPEAPPATV